MRKINTQNKQEKKIKRNSILDKTIGLLLLSIVSIIAVLPGVMAHCPLCTAATIVGVGVTRSLGWDDSIVGVFVGAMIVSSALWLNNTLKKKDVGGNALLRVSSITAATFVLTVLSFYYAGLFGPANSYRIFGMEKILFGTLSGAVASFAAFFVSNEIKKKNNGQVLFNYQTIVLTFTVLALNALLFWRVFK